MDKRNDITFDKRSDKYDEGFEGKLSERFYSNLVMAVEAKDGYRVLDVGCGTGTILKRISNKAKIEGFGIDVSKPMLEEAKQKCPDMLFQVGDCAALPFEDNSFDVVTACMAYHHFPSQSGFRKEALRILKPGGTLYVCDPKFPNHIRKTMNGFFKISKTNARFYKPEEMKKDFEQSSFKFDKLIEDAYVQVLSMKK